jgi:hypothetical protein
MGLHKMAGTGDAVFSAQMGDFHENLQEATAYKAVGRCAAPYLH